MGVLDYILLALVGTALVLAVRGARHKKGCCGNCASCCGCTHKKGM